MWSLICVWRKVSNSLETTAFQKLNEKFHRLLSFTKAESIDTQSIVHLSKTELEEETKLR